ncbi:MAG: FecR domain-containing protein [Deltaproteobacteria bacterium]|nr:MAG: FecR domain-containing protein [Deltaproteobacteria bacterium]
MKNMPEAEMIASPNRANFPKLGFAVIFFAFALISPGLSAAQERYPSVARISFVSGPVSYSRGDDPDEWDDAIENVPLTIGDRIYAPEDGRAELQLPSGNFVRLAPRSYFTALNLSDDIKQFYLGEGAASFNIRRLRSDEVIEIDTPNVSVTLDQPGRYRIAVDEDGNSRISVRRGRVIVAASGRQITVENSEIRIYGTDSPRYEIVGLPATDAFDRWVAERDDRFDRAYSGASRYASEEIIGVEDLSDYGRWENIPEYGYAWTPSVVAAGWAPFSVGRWFWQDPWGWTWISGERWGWATSHYGRWMPYRSRWYWVPVRPRTRVIYAPACVEFVRVRDHVGWFPLHPRDRFIPWWERRDRRSINQNITYVNRTYVTVVNQNTFISARPVTEHIVRDAVVLREASSARMTWEPLPIPSRSSLRVVSETGERRNQRPSANVLARAAVVRTAPPAPPPTFQEKLPEIQKSQGKPIAPSTAVALTSQNDKTRAPRVPIRPAAVEVRGGDFAPRTPGATSGPAPQPLTAARGKKLATRENPVDTSLFEKAKSAEKPSAQPQPLPPSPSEPNKGTAGRPESPRPEQDRDRQRQEKQTLERERQAQQQLQKQQELERKQQEQQKEAERKAQPQQKQQDQELRQQLRQQQLQDRQAQEQQKQQELERRQQGRQTEAERKAQLQQRQQEQIRLQQLRQQQLQERQGREPQIEQQRPELKSQPLPQQQQAK